MYRLVEFHTTEVGGRAKLFICKLTAVDEHDFIDGGIVMRLEQCEQAGPQHGPRTA